MHQEPTKNSPNFFEVGMLIGIAFGLLDALQAIALTGGASSHVMSALILSILIWAAGGAIGLPLILWTLGRFQPSLDMAQPLGRNLLMVLSRFFVSVVGISACGFLVGWSVIRILPSLNYVVAALIGFVTTGLAILALMKLRNRVAANLPRAVNVILGITCLAFIAGVLVLGGTGDLSARIDSGQAESLDVDAPETSGLPNILFIVIDTVRADHLSLYGYPKETTPFLSELAGESTVYERAISPAPWTLPSHASMFTGQFPSVHQASWEHALLRSEFVTIAEILRDKGYSTVGFSSNSVVGAINNLQQGFEHFFEVWKTTNHALDPIRKLKVYRTVRHFLGGEKWSDKGAVTTNSLVSGWLDRWEKEKHRRPFFMFINYLEPHLPYNPPEQYRSQFFNGPLSANTQELSSKDSWMPAKFRSIGIKGSLTSEDYRQLTLLYDAELAYQDAILRELVEDLKGRGLLENTFLVVVSDHGENIGEHGGLLGHCLSVHQTLLHVPLLVRYPPLFAKDLRYPRLVSILSIFTTLMEVAKASPSPEWPPALGPLPRSIDDTGLDLAIAEYALPAWELSNLVNEVHGVNVRPYAVRLKAIQNESWKLIWRSEGDSTFYDLSSDPGEREPLDPTSIDQGLKLQKELETWLASLNPPKFPPPTVLVTPDKQTKDSLRSLGYAR